MKGIRRFFFSNTTFRQTIVKNTFWLTLGQITVRLAKIVTVIVATHTLTVADYGVFTYILSFASVFFVAVALVSVLGPFIRTVSTLAPEELGRYVGTYLIWRTAAGFLTGFVLLLVASYFVDAQNLLLLAVIATSLLFDFMHDFFASLLHARKEMQKDAASLMVQSVVLIAVAPLALTAYASPLVLACSYALASAASMVIAAGYAIREYPLVFSFDHRAMPHMLRSSLEAGIAWAGFNTLLFPFLQLCVGHTGTLHEVAYTAIAIQVFQLTSLPAIFLLSAMFPVLTTLSYEEPRTHEITKLMYEGVISGLGFITCLVIVCAPYATIIFGTSYESAVPAIRLMACALPAFGISAVVFYEMMARGMLARFFWWFVGGAATAIPSAYVYIVYAHMGAYGAAAALVTSYWLLAIGIVYQYFSYGNLLRDSWRTVLAILIFGVFLLLGGLLQMPLMGAIAGIIGYGGVFIALPSPVRSFLAAHDSMLP
jgi:O-antigen/teichoic acid export membrane protein